MKFTPAGPDSRPGIISSPIGGQRRPSISFRHLVIAGVAIWLLLLVAGVSAYIYREIDGATVRSLLSENLALQEQLDKTAHALDSAQNQLVDTKAQLTIANARNSDLNSLFTRTVIDNERTRSLLREMMSAAPMHRLPPSIP